MLRSHLRSSLTFFVLLALALGAAAQDGLFPPSGADQGAQDQGWGGFGGGPSITSGLSGGGSQGFGAGVNTDAQVQNSILSRLDLTFIQGDRTIAWVGDDVITLSEVLPEMHLLMQSQSPEAVLAYVRQEVPARLPKLITTRLVIQDFEHTIPKEHQGEARAQFVSYFEKSMVPDIMEKAKASSRAELVAMLREQGMSLDQMRKTQTDQLLMGAWLREKVKPKEITREDLLQYYKDNEREFDFPSRAKWEQISVLKSGRARDEAYAQICNWGNAVVKLGVPFERVAKDHSEGPTASEGGKFDWTTKGSLISKPLDEALFTQQVGAMGPIIEDDRGFHIIRVTEREMAGTRPFEEVQDQLRTQLRQADQEQQLEVYMAELRAKTLVRSILDKPSEQQPQQGPSNVLPAAASVGG